MTDRVCPRCTSAIVIPVVDSDQKQIGFQCSDCGIGWTEFELKPAAAPKAAAVTGLPAIDPIRGGHLE